MVKAIFRRKSRYKEEFFFLAKKQNKSKNKQPSPQNNNNNNNNQTKQQQLNNTKTVQNVFTQPLYDVWDTIELNSKVKLKFLSLVTWNLKIVWKKKKDWLVLNNSTKFNML